MVFYSGEKVIYNKELAVMQMIHKGLWENENRIISNAYFLGR